MSVKLFTEEKKLRTNRRTLNDATEEMIKHTESMGIDTVFSRQAKYDESFIGLEKSRCYFGSMGICCKQCAMGPCRIWHEDLPVAYRTIAPQLNKGTCGASADTIVARNLLMTIGRGTAAHASHALHIASRLKNVNKENIKSVNQLKLTTIKELDKLRSIATKLGTDIDNVASCAISDIVGFENSMKFATSYCTEKTNKKLAALGVIPGSVGKELLSEGHETSMGTMADPTSLILHAARLGIADIAALTISSEFQDVLLGIPKPVTSKIGFNVLDKNKVNVVIHGHTPLLAEKIVELSEDKELLKRVNAINASGINIVGCCCTGNEILMRKGISLAGSNLQQELIIATGLVEAFVVDMQCIYPNIENVAKEFHTKIITTMNEARLPNAEHVTFEADEDFDKTARRILDIAIQNFQKRGENVYLPKEEPKDLIAGFSVETCLNVLSKINPEDPLKPLIDNIISGNIYGVVLLAGCTSPKVTADASHVTIAKHLMENNVLIISTGCAAQACAREGLLTHDVPYTGAKLKGVLTLLGEVAGLDKPLPPIWHFGSCVDNSRVIILATALAERLGVSVSDLPIAASAAEWVTEKAAAIGTGAMALGITVHLGVTPPIIGSPEIVSLLTKKSEELFGGKFIVEIDPDKAAQLILNHITEARKRLGLGTN